MLLVLIRSTEALLMKHTLLVLIRSTEALLMSTDNICFMDKSEKYEYCTFWLEMCLTCSYGKAHAVPLLHNKRIDNPVKN